MLQNICSILAEKRDFFFDLLWEHIWISITVVVIAIILGGLIGILISQHRNMARPVLIVINFLYTIPSISMLGFLIPFSGVGNTTAIIALCVYALLPMVRNTYTAVMNVDPAIIEAARGMGSTKLQLLFKIQIPLAMPVIMSGIRSMTTMTIALTGIASFIGAGGLGVAIYRGITTNNAAMTITGSLIIALLALAMDALLGFIDGQMKHDKARSTKKRIFYAVLAAAVAVAFLISTLQWNKRENVIHIATKPMTEQYILGEMLSLMIRQDTGLEVELTQGVGGGVANIWPAMESGEFDLYPEYTGTGWNVVLKHDSLYSNDMFDSLQREYNEDYNMQWIGMYGFNNTYGIAVRREIAEKYDLHTYSDLKDAAHELRFGAEYDFFEREDGYDSLCSYYGLDFKETMDLDIGLKYQALNQEQIDVMLIFTTDGQLASSDVVILEDDKGLFPSYRCGNVVRNKILDRYPELSDVMEKFTGIISDSDMALMNYKVEIEGKEPADVAEKFLTESGLLK